jgi:hypothetical protein
MRACLLPEGFDDDNLDDDDLDELGVGEYIEERLKELEAAEELAGEVAELALEGSLIDLMAEQLRFRTAAAKLLGGW